MCAKLLQSCPTLGKPMDCSLSGSSIHEILQTRILEWVAMLSSRVSSWSRSNLHLLSSALADGFFTCSVTWEAQVSYNINTIFKKSLLPVVCWNHSYSWWEPTIIIRNFVGQFLYIQKFCELLVTWNHPCWDYFHNQQMLQTRAFFFLLRELAN